MDTTTAPTGGTAEDLRARLPAGPARLNRAFNRLTSPRAAPDWLLHVHRWAYQRSDGRIGHGIGGHPALLLHTTGRRTGISRCTALAYAVDSGRLIVAASNSGADKSPAWFYNLQTNPVVELQVGRLHLRARASVVDVSDPAYQRIWGLINASINGRLDAYRAKTSRQIPLVAMVPILGEEPTGTP